MTTIVTLKKFLDASNYKVQEGSPFLWKCYGPDAHYLDCGNFRGFGLHDHWMSSAIFDCKTQRVYEARMWLNTGQNTKAWRWVHPKYKKASKDEHEARGVKYNDATDGVEFVNCSTPEKFLATIKKIVKKFDGK